MCNSLLSEHPKDKLPSTDLNKAKISSSMGEGDGATTCCGRFWKRALHTSQVMIVTFMAIVCFLALLISGVSFEVDTEDVSNLQLDSEADAVQFWFRTNRIGLSIIDYGEQDEDGNKPVNSMYTYSSSSLNNYNCDMDTSCEQTVDDLAASWNTLLLACSMSAIACVAAWLVSLPRNCYPVLHCTPLYQSGLQNDKTVMVWLLKPVGLTYLLTITYTVVFGIQFFAMLKYVSNLPSNEEMYKLSLQYMNSDSSLCPSSNPCDYSYDSIYSFWRNFAFLIVAVVFAGLSILFVAASHQLKLKSTRWECLKGCCQLLCNCNQQRDECSQRRSQVPRDDLENGNEAHSDCPVAESISDEFIQDKASVQMSSLDNAQVAIRFE